MWNQIKTVWQIEMASHLRDRRALLGVLGFSLVGPLGAFLMVWVLNNTANAERDVLLDVVGAQHAPGLVQWLGEQDIRVTSRNTAELEGVPQLGNAELILVIPEDFSQRYQSAIPARMRLYRDDRENRSLAAHEKVKTLLHRFESDVADMRLNARGIPAHVVKPFIIDTANVAGSDSGSLNFANTLLYFLIFAPFFAGIAIANDTTAGERERSSLLPLLAQPIGPVALAVGKYLTVSCFVLAGMSIAVVTQFNLLQFAPLDELNINLQLNLAGQAQVILILLPLALAIAALQLIVALLAKSFKEAQTYLTILSFVPVGLAMYATLAGSQATELLRLLPVLGQIELMRGVVAGQLVDITDLLLVSLVMLLVGGIGLYLAVRRLNDERLLSAA